MCDQEWDASILYSVACLPEDYFQANNQRVRSYETRFKSLLRDELNRAVFDLFTGQSSFSEAPIVAQSRFSDLKKAVEDERKLAAY